MKDKIKVQTISCKGKHNNIIEFIVPRYCVDMENHHNIISIINSLIVDLGYSKFRKDRRLTVYDDIIRACIIFRFELTYEDTLHKQFYSDYSYRKYNSNILFRKF